MRLVQFLGHPSLLGGSEQWEPVLVEAEAPQNAEELYIEVQVLPNPVRCIFGIGLRFTFFESF